MVTPTRARGRRGRRGVNGHNVIILCKYVDMFTRHSTPSVTGRTVVQTQGISCCCYLFSFEGGRWCFCFFFSRFLTFDSEDFPTITAETVSVCVCACAYNTIRTREGVSRLTRASWARKQNTRTAVTRVGGRRMRLSTEIVRIIRPEFPATPFRRARRRVFT